MLLIQIKGEINTHRKAQVSIVCSRSPWLSRSVVVYKSDESKAPIILTASIQSTIPYSLQVFVYHRDAGGASLFAALVEDSWH
mmetsp:Transcript_36040/g.58245  ORF Transcript_36040/g.58245 Transcript_36040/m.58245 type:complete len:83 (+) Transcript_36040:359-607(+)